MSKQIVKHVPGAVPPLPVFSHAAISKGFAFISGSIGCDHEFNVLGDVRSQTRAALDNMKKLLHGSQSDLEHVVKVNVYLTNLPRDFHAVNEVYQEFFKEPEAMPARTCVGVVALPMGASVEFECIAEVPPRED